MEYVLHNYFRSSTSYRVRAAMKLKGLAYEYVSYALKDGENHNDQHRALNPQGLVPTLQTSDGSITQSLAILEWLDETHPEPALLPEDAWGRARVRSLAQIVALDIHPLNNLRMLNYINTTFNADQKAVAAWFCHWVAEAFKPLEERLANEAETGTFCHGQTPGLADLCLAGQVINNRRFDVPMQNYPTINRIFAACMEIPAFKEAAPDNQPDAV